MMIDKTLIEPLRMALNTEAVTLISDITEEWTKKWYPSDEKGKISKKARDCAKIIDTGDFGCQDKAVRKLVGAIIDEKLPGRGNERGVEFVINLCLVPLKNDNSHSYELNKPCLMVQNNSSIAYTPSGETRNHLTSIQQSLRPATRDEIETFVKKLPTKTLIDVLDVDLG